MTEDSDFSGHPGDLTEDETLSRLTIEEKREIAEPAIEEFPHLHKGMVQEWLEGYGCDAKVSVSASVSELVDVLLDCLEQKVESGEEPEALDHFIYGYLNPAMLDDVGIDPEEFVERDPLDEWEGLYDE